MIELSTLFTSPGDTGDDPLLQESHLNILPVDSDHGDQLQDEPTASPLRFFPIKSFFAERKLFSQLEKQTHHVNSEFGESVRLLSHGIRPVTSAGKELFQIIEKYSDASNEELGYHTRAFIKSRSC